MRNRIPVNLPGWVIVECLPALVGAAPVVGGPHPPPVPAVQVPGVVVAQDHTIPLPNTAYAVRKYARPIEHSKELHIYTYMSSTKVSVRHGKKYRGWKQKKTMYSRMEKIKFLFMLILREVTGKMINFKRKMAWKRGGRKSEKTGRGKSNNRSKIRKKHSRVNTLLKS